MHALFWWIANNTYRWWPDGLWLRLIYRLKMGAPLHLRHPKLFTEKLQWLKIHDRNPEHIQLVDKHDVKKFIADNFGEQYVIPSYGVWSSFDDIDFDSLPSQFVLKCTHDSGGVCICRDKSTFNKSAARQKIEHSLQHNFYYWTREWPYKFVKPRIIAEKFMDDDGVADLTDYKFYCFGGKAVYCQVIANRSSGETIDFYDREWVHQPFIGLNADARHAANEQTKPGDYSQMLALADAISTRVGSPFVRVDLYYIRQRIYFGEITFFPGGGTGTFTPSEWNRILGDMTVLPNK